MRTVGILAVICAAGACGWAGDAQRGALVVSAQGCLECHTVGGQGAGHEPSLDAGAPDLAENLMPTYTPSALASALWNHTPQMWRKIAEREVSLPTATSAEWEDVFAYIYSLQFSERPAEVRRGKLAFENNGCSACHSGPACHEVPESLWRRGPHWAIRWSWFFKCGATLRTWVRNSPG